MPSFREREGKTFDFACRRMRETDNAVLVYDEASKEDVWIPFSQVVESHFDKNGYGTLVITEWIARQKGLIK